MATTGRLTPKQERFVEEYLVDRNATAAAIRAGYSQKVAKQQGRENIAKPLVAAAIEERGRKLAERTAITQEMVLQRWWQIATANPNELIQYRRLCCRHCFGEGFRYQWRDEAEHVQACIAAAREGADPPDNAGGYGFDPTLRPHPKCPACHGEGEGDVFANDTRDLSEAAVALYAGVKITRDGFEIKMQDQGKALENVARHLGMFKDKFEFTGKDGTPVEIQYYLPDNGRD